MAGWIYGGLNAFVVENFNSENGLDLVYARSTDDLRDSVLV